MTFENILPLLIALAGGGGIVGLITAFLGRRNHKDDKQMEMVKLAYERNVYLEERNALQDEEIASLRLKLGQVNIELEQKKQALATLTAQQDRLEEQNKYIERLLKEHKNNTQHYH